MLKFVMSGLLVWAGANAMAVEPWQEQALKEANKLGETVEVLDETLHEAYEHQQSPEFKAAIEDIHHIEKVLEQFRNGMLTLPFNELCQLNAHLVEDLNEVRLDLIQLGLQHNPQVVQAWNNMAHQYNHHLYPFFRTCPPHSWSSGRGEAGVGIL